MTILWLPRVKPWLKFVLQKNCFPHIIDSTLRLIFSRSPQPVNKLLVWWTRLKKRIQHVLWYYFVGTPGNYLIPDVVSRSSYILISISIWSCHLPHSPLPTPPLHHLNIFNALTKKHIMLRCSLVSAFIMLLSQYQRWGLVTKNTEFGGGLGNL